MTLTRAQRRAQEDRMFERRKRWARAERVRARWTDADFDAEAERLKDEIADFLAKSDATSPPRSAP